MKTDGDSLGARVEGAERTKNAFSLLLTILGTTLALPGLTGNLGGFRPAMMFFSVCLLVAAVLVRAFNLYSQKKFDLPFAVMAIALAASCFLLGVFSTYGDSSVANNQNSVPPLQPNIVPTASGPTESGSSVPTPSSNITETPVSPPAAPGIYKNGTSGVDVNPESYDDAFDFDDWISVRGGDSSSGFDADLVVTYKILSGMNGAVIAAIDPFKAPRSYESCVTALKTGQITSIQLSGIKPGARICLRTSEGRVAIIDVTAVPSETENLSTFEFAATVWNAKR